MKRIIIFLFVITLFSLPCYSQGKIKDAEDSLKKTSNKSSIKSQTASNKTNNRGSNFFVDMFGHLIIEAFVYSIYGIAFETPMETKHKGSHAFLTKYPYINSNTGNYSYEWNENTEIFTTTLTNRFIFETNRLQGNHLNVDIQFLKRFGLELDYLQLWERNHNFGDNAIAIYTALTKYHRIRTERFNGFWGLGATYVDGDVDDFGFTYALGAELFFANPMSLESNFNQTLINSNTINSFNLLLNFYKKQYKFTGGYEHLKIGSVPFSNVSLGLGVTF